MPPESARLGALSPYSTSPARAARRLAPARRRAQDAKALADPEVGSWLLRKNAGRPSDRTRDGPARRRALRAGVQPGRGFEPFANPRHSQEHRTASDIDERGGRDTAADHVEHDAERLRQDESGEEHGQRLAPDELDRRDEPPGEPPAAFAGQSIGEIGDRKEMDDAQRREMRLVDQRTERLMDFAKPWQGPPPAKHDQPYWHENGI